MTVKQISVFVENKPGQLAELTDVLNKNKIDMRALSIAETPDFGIVRLIVDDAYETACVLKKADYICSITPVLAVEIPDVPGGLSNVLQIMKKHKINLEYTYAFIARKKDFAYMVFRVDDNKAAIDILVKNKIKLLCPEDLQNI